MFDVLQIKPNEAHHAAIANQVTARIRLCITEKKGFLSLYSDTQKEASFTQSL
jgi:hypothetical protein